MPRPTDREIAVTLLTLARLLVHRRIRLRAENEVAIEDQGILALADLPEPEPLMRTGRALRRIAEELVTAAPSSPARADAARRLAYAARQFLQQVDVGETLLAVLLEVEIILGASGPRRSRWR